MPRTALPLGTWGKISARKQPSGKWRAHARFRAFDGRTTPVNRFGDTKGKAETKLREELRRRVSEMDVLSGDTSVTVFAQHWLDSVEEEARIRGQSLDQYKSYTRRLVVPALGELKMREVTVQHCEKFLRSQVADGKGYSRAAICTVVLGGIMQYGVRQRAILSNPVRDAAKVPAKKPTPVRALTVDQVHAVRAAVAVWVRRRGKAGPKPSHNLVDLVEIMLGTGLRIGEVLGLRWEDVDLKAAIPTVSVEGTLVKRSGHALERQPFPKSDDSRRAVILPGFVVDVLMDRMVASPLENPINAVFVNRKGSWLAPSGMNKDFRDALDHAGLERSWIKPHVLRKTVATVVSKAVDDEHASRQLGHSNVKVTRKHYIERIHLAPDVRAALDVLAPSGLSSGSPLD